MINQSPIGYTINVQNKEIRLDKTYNVKALIYFSNTQLHPVAEWKKNTSPKA